MLKQPLLYVEDEPNDAMLLEVAFRHAGISNPLKVVSDGEQAVEYLSGKGIYADREKYPLPCLVLLDLNLPLKPGFDVLRWMRAHPNLRTLPVLIFTSSDRPHDINLAYQLGANGYLIKSPSLAEWKSRAAAIRDFWLIHNLAPVPLMETHLVR